MPIEYRSPRPGLVVATATGTLDDRQVVEHRRAVVDERRFGDEFDLLFDLRGVEDHLLTTAGVRSLATAAPENHPVRNMVLVADGDVLYGYARMYQNLAPTPIRLQVCRTLEEAEAWLASVPDGASPEDGLRSHWPEAGATADQTTSGLRHSISQ